MLGYCEGPSENRNISGMYISTENTFGGICFAIVSTEIKKNTKAYYCSSNKLHKVHQNLMRRHIKIYLRVIFKCSLDFP